MTSPPILLDYSQESGGKCRGHFNKFKCMNKKELVLRNDHSLWVNHHNYLWHQSWKVEVLNFYLQLSKYISKSWATNFIFFPSRKLQVDDYIIEPPSLMSNSACSVLSGLGCSCQETEERAASLHTGLWLACVDVADRLNRWLRDAHAHYPKQSVGRQARRVNILYYFCSC